MGVASDASFGLRAPMSDRWSRTTRYWVIAVSVVLGALFLYAIQPLFRPLIIAALIAYVLNPVVDFMDRRTRLPRLVVVSSTFIVVLVAFGVVVITVVPDLVGQFVASLDELARVELDIAARTGIDLQLTGEIKDIQGRATRWLGNATNVVALVQSLSANLIWTLVGLVSAYYLLLDWTRLRDWLIALAPRPAQADLIHLYGEVRTVWQRYLRGQLSLMFIVGALSGIGGALVGLPGAAALGFAAGVLDVIPTFGPWVAMAIATIIAWLAGSLFLNVSNAAFALLILVIYALVQLVENVWLRPRIMGSSVRLHPAVVLIAFFTALTLSGVILAILIVPLVATAMILGRYIRGRLFGVDPFEGVDPSGISIPVELAEQAGVVTGGRVIDSKLKAGDPAAD